MKCTAYQPLKCCGLQSNGESNKNTSAFECLLFQKGSVFLRRQTDTADGSRRGLSNVARTNDGAAKVLSLLTKQWLLEAANDLRTLKRHVLPRRK